MNWGSELLGPLGCVLVAAAGAVLVGRARWRPAVRDAAWAGLGLLAFVGAGSWWWAGGAEPHAVAAAAFAAAAVWAAAKANREGRRPHRARRGRVPGARPRPAAAVGPAVGRLAGRGRGRPPAAGRGAAGPRTGRPGGAGMTEFLMPLLPWLTAGVLSVAAAVVPVVALWRWRRHPVPTVFLVPAALCLWPWAAQEGFRAWETRVELRADAELEARRAEIWAGPRPAAGDPLSLWYAERNTAETAASDDYFVRVMSDPLVGWAYRRGFVALLKHRGISDLSRAAACVLALAAVACRGRWGPAGLPARSDSEGDHRCTG